MSSAAVERPALQVVALAAPSSGGGPSDGLLDRQAFDDALDQALAPAPGVPGVRSVILLEISSFDLVSEAFGSEVGLGVVRCCAHQLATSVHPDDLVARSDDHTFVVWCPHAPSSADALAYGDQLRAQLGRPSGLRHVGGALQVSAGVAVATAEVTTAADLVQRSRTALLAARPEATTRLYEAAMRDVLMRQVELEALVASVIERGVVDLAYQPVVRLDDQRTVGAEALLRVTDASGAPVPPGDLIEAAEQSGQIDELGDLILRTACAAAVRWRGEASDHPIQLAVNLSCRQLDDPALPSRVVDALDATGFDASSLWLEITESALMRNPTRSTAILAELKARGIRLAADDFGTGYSSLAYLKTFPLDALKIDREFVAAMPTGQQEVAITRAVVAVADALGLEVIAEGIERHDQRECVASLGVALAQGYLWSPAVPAEAFGARLSAECDSARIGASASNDPTPRVRSTPGSATSAEEHIDAILEVLAHEIRNPLAVVHGYAGLIESSDLADDREGGAAIQRAAARIEDIIEQLTGVSRRAGRSGTGIQAPVDIVATVDRIVAELQLITPVELRIAERPTATSVSANATQIEQAVTNILSNAIRFSPDGAPVDVAVRTDHLWVDIDVSDQGPGVEPADLGLLFCKYGRADPAGQGSGLGLYLARRIARAHGGDVLVRRRTSSPGTTFTIRLPRCPDDPSSTSGLLPDGPPRRPGPAG